MDLASNTATYSQNLQATIEWSNSLVIRLSLVAELGFLSSLMASALFVYLLVEAIKRYQKRKASEPARPKLQPISVIFMLAIFMDIIQGLGQGLSIVWAIRGGVDEVGPYDTPSSICTTQAVLQQIGDTGAAWCTIWIAILTVWKPEDDKRWARLTFAIVALIFGFLILIIAIPATTLKAYYVNTSLWCWIQYNDPISDNHGPTREALRIASEYAVFWVAVLVSLGCYTYIFWKSRTVTKHLEPKYAKYIAKRRQEANATVWWPIAYTLQILPISIVRFIQFHPGSQINPGWVIAVTAIFSLSGIINVSLWLITGRQFGFTSTEGEDSDSSLRMETHRFSATTLGRDVQGYNGNDDHTADDGYPVV